MASGKEQLEVLSPVSGKCQVTLPKAIRNRLGIEAGDRVAFVMHADGTVVLRKPRLTVKDLVGILQPLSLSVDRQLEIARSERAEGLARDR